MNTDTIQLLKRSIVEHLGCPPDSVTPSSRFEADLGADSLDTIELAMAWEEDFCIHIPDDRVEQFITVQQAADYIDRKLQEKSQ